MISDTYGDADDRLWTLIDAIQNAPYVPDWSKKPEWATALQIRWSSVPKSDKGYFDRVTADKGASLLAKGLQWEEVVFLPAPEPAPAPQPTDAELSAMFDKLPIEERRKMLGVDSKGVK